MKELKFIEGNPPKGFKPAFDSFIFNTDTHRALQTREEWTGFHLLNERGKSVVVSLYMYIEEEKAISPLRAPFGSIECAPETSAKIIFDFLRQVEAYLRRKKIVHLEIKNPPAAYQPLLASVLDVVFLNSGYVISDAEINASLPIDEISFDRKVDPWELRKLKQIKRASLKFQVIPPEAVKLVYDFLVTCRTERKQSLSMSFDQLQETIEALPDKFFLFGIFQQDELVAASIAVQVSPNILYNFYSGHPKKHDALSPVVFLIKGMYTWCLDNQIDLLDLGTSAIDGAPNFGLLDFKLNLGGTPSSKFTYTKDLL